MSTVDNRVVKMTFDNEEFEQNVRDTIDTLSDFEEALNLDGATAGIESIEQAANDLDISDISLKASAEADAVDDSFDSAKDSIANVDSAAEDVDFSPISSSAETTASDVTQAMGDIDLTSITTEAEEAAGGFTALETIATGALLGIGNSIQGYVVDKLSSLGSILKSFTLDPISEGFGEYELQMGSIQTILANTGRSFGNDQDIQEVNDALGQLNEYADKTIYKFSDMTQAIGTFTSSGLDLEEAVSAVQGVSNVAALSGASKSDLHRVLPQLSQALAGDSVSLMDWQSVRTANMANRIFETALADTAEHMARAQLERGEIDVADYEGIAEAAQAVMDGMSVYASLNEDTGFGKWLSSNALAETLRTFTYDFENASEESQIAIKNHLTELGYREEEMQAIFDRAKMATQSAVEVRTWSQLWDTVGEAIGTGWAEVWGYIIGDFKQSTDTFTFLSETMSGAIGGMFEGIIEHARIFNESGARELIFGSFIRNSEGDIEEGAKRVEGALDNLVTAIGKPLQAIKDAFTAVFGQEDEESIGYNMVQFALAFKDFTASLIISDDMATGLRNMFEGLFGVIDIVLQVVLDLVAAFGGFLDIIRTITDPLLDIAAAIGGALGSALLWVHDRFFEVREAVIEATKPIRDAIEVVKEIITKFFELADIPGKIRGLADFFGDLMTTLWDLADIPGKIRGLSDVFEAFLAPIANFTGWTSAVEKANEVFEATGQQISAVDIWFQQIMQSPIGGFFEGISDAILNVFPPFQNLIDAFGASEDELRESYLIKFWTDVKDKIDEVTGGSLSSFFEALSNGLTTAATLLGNFVVLFAEGIGGAIILTFNLVSAIGNFVIKLGEAFLAWEPIKNVIDTLGAFKDGAINFFLDLPNRIGAMATDLDGQLGGVQGIFGGILTWFEDTTNYFNSVTVEQFIQDMKDWANGIIENVLNVWDHITNLDPNTLFEDIKRVVRDVYSDLWHVADWLEGYFPEIDGILTGGLENVFSVIHGTLTDIQNFLQPIWDESNSLPEFFIRVIGAIAQIVHDKLYEIREAIINFDIVEAFKEMFANAAHLNTVIYSFLYDVAAQIESELPALDGILTGGLHDIFMTIATKLGEIRDFIIPILEESDSLPDFFVNLFSKIGQAILDGFQGIAEQITSFDPHKLFEGWTGINEVIYTIVQDWFPDLAPIVNPALDTITGFFLDITDGTDDWGEVFLRIMGKIGEGIAGIPDMIGNAFEILKGAIVDGLVFITEKLEVIPGPIGELFGTLHDKLIEAKDNVEDGAKTLPGKFKEMFNIEGPVGNALDSLDTFWSGFTFEAIPESAGGFVETFKGFIQDKIDKVQEFIGGLPSTFGEMLGTFNEFLNSEELENITRIIQDVLIAKFVVGSAEFLKGMGNLAAGFGDKMKGKEYESLGDKAKKIAIAIGILAAAIWVVSTIEDPLAAVATLAGVGLVMVALQTIAGLIDNSPFAKGGSDALIKAAGAIGVFALSLLAVTWVVPQLTAFDWGANIPGLLAMVVGLGILAGLTRLIGDGGAHAITAAASMAIMVGVLWLLLPVIKEYVAFAQQVNKDDYEKVAATLGVMAAALVVMAGSMRLAGEHGIGAGIGFVLMAAGLIIIKDVLIELSAVDINQLAIEFAMLGVLMMEFAVIAEQTKATDLVGTAAALIVFGGALTVIAWAIGILAEKDWPSILVAGAALGVLMFALYELTTKVSATDILATSAAMLIFGVAVGLLAVSLAGLSMMDVAGVLTAAGAITVLIIAFGALAAITGEMDLIATAASITVFAVGVGLLALALAGLTLVDPERLQGAAIAIGALVGVFGLLAVVLSIPVIAEGAAIVLPMLALAFIAVGAAAVLIGAGLVLAVEAITQLAIAGPILSMFADIVAQNAGDFLIAAGTLTVFSVAMTVLGAALLVFGAGAVVAGGGLTLLAGGIRAILELIPDLPELIDNAAQTITDFFTSIPERLGAAIDAIANWFNNVFIPSVGEFFVEIFNKLGELKDKFVDWLQNTALPALSDAAGKFWNWVTTEGIPKLQEFIGEVMKGLGDLLSRFGTWLQNEGLPALSKAAGDFWHWVTTEGIPKLQEFIGEVMKGLGDLLSQFGTWLQNEGLPALSKAAGDFWHWVTTEGIPKLGDFIKEIFNTLGGLLGQLKDWVFNEGIPAAGQAVQDILNALGEKAGDFIEWGKSLPGKAWEGIQNAWGTLLDIGGSIVDGIVQGLGDGAQAVINAVTGLGESALNSIKNFFGIASPSKVMADEVGRYIPEGLAMGIKNAAYEALNSGADLGEGTLAEINNAMKGLNGYEFDIDGTAHVTPVVTTDSLESFRHNMLEGIEMSSGDIAADVTNDINTAQQITTEMNTTSLRGTIQDTSKDTNSLLNDLVLATRENGVKLMSAVVRVGEARQNIYLDTGALVGAITPMVDQSLGDRYSMASRGVY